MVPEYVFLPEKRTRPVPDFITFVVPDIIPSTKPSLLLVLKVTLAKPLTFFVPQANCPELEINSNERLPEE